MSQDKTASRLLDEFQFFLDNQEEIAFHYPGRYVAIKGRQIIGEHETLEQAVHETGKREPAGTFLVQKAETGSECYTQRFHSRVTF